MCTFLNRIPVVCTLQYRNALVGYGIYKYRGNPANLPDHGILGTKCSKNPAVILHSRASSCVQLLLDQPLNIKHII
jgi:hypothetical protein